MSVFNSLASSISFLLLFVNLCVYCLSSSLEYGFQDNMSILFTYISPAPRIIQQMTESIFWQRKLATHYQHVGGRFRSPEFPSSAFPSTAGVDFAN